MANSDKPFDPADAQVRKGDILVLGAGFSRALTDKAPLMKGFLTAPTVKGAYVPEFHIELTRALLQYFGGKLEDVNIEELATFLADESSEGWPPFFNRKAAYDQLVWVITNTLAPAWDGALESPSLPFARLLAKNCVAEQVPIVTLNYDLIMDNLLHETKSWNPDFGYGAKLQSPFDEHFDTMDKQVPGSVAPLMHPGTLLLKLHGSLNWGIRKAPHPDGTNPVEILSSDKLENLAVRQGAKVEWPPIARTINTILQTPYAPGLPGNPNMIFEPLIVPPVSQKLAASGHPFLAYCQYLAREALSQAKRIIVVGYSLPPADFGIRSLFRAAMGTLSAQGELTNRDTTIMVINRNDEVVARFREFFALFPKTTLLRPFKECTEWLQEAVAS